MNKEKEYTKEELKTLTTKHHYLTVGDLKKAIADLDDSVPVIVERVEDKYYETGGWKVYKTENMFTHFLRKNNELIISGEYFNEDNYPDLKPENVVLATEEEINDAKDQFHPAFCANASLEKDLLFIHLHY